MSILSRAASRTLAMLPPSLAVQVMVRLSRVQPLLSARHRRVDRLITALAGPSRRLRYGPFAGMRYFDFSAGSLLLPKFAGTYEWELLDIVSRVVALAPDVVVDIGAAEGYYAVGLAARARSRVVAYEIEPVARGLCRRLAAINGVADRVDVRSRCTPDALEHVLRDAARPVVICDVEGAEDELLDPSRTPALSRAAVLVELHDTRVAGVSNRVRSRFRPTHDIEEVQDVARVRSMLPRDVTLSDDDAALVMDERRDPSQVWFWMTPRGRT